MTVTAAQDPRDRRWLARAEVIHPLIKAALVSCSPEGISETAAYLAKGAVRIIYAAASLGDTNPSPTVEQIFSRLKIIELGGLVCLLHIAGHATEKGIKEFSENAGVRQHIVGKDLRATLDSLRIHLGGRKVLVAASRAESGSLLPNVKTPEMFRSLSRVQRMISEAGEDERFARKKRKRRAKAMLVVKEEVCYPGYKTERENWRRCLGLAADLGALVRELDELVKKGQQETRRRDEVGNIRKKVKRIDETRRREEIFQEYLQEIDQHKRDRVAQIGKLTDMKAAAADGLDAAQRGNEERMTKRLERVRRQADKEKLRVLNLERRLAVQQEQNLTNMQRYQVKALTSASKSKLNVSLFGIILE